MIMQAADVPSTSERVQSLMAVVLAIDWFMDRCRTCINVYGDSVRRHVLCCCRCCCWLLLRSCSYANSGNWKKTECSSCERASWREQATAPP